MTGSEYLNDLNLALTEVQYAGKFFYEYLAVYELAEENTEFGALLTRDSQFWHLHTYSLQTSFFILLGRIFDGRRDSHSLIKVVQSTVGHCALFSRTALAERKLREGLSESDAIMYAASAWEPTENDLKNVQEWFDQRAKQYSAIYKPIRDKIFAHYGVKDRGVRAELIQGVQVTEFLELLRGLRALAESLWHLFQNGREPQLDATFGKDQHEIKQATQKIFAALLDGTKR